MGEKGARLVRGMTVLNAALLVWNLFGTWLLFFTYGRRPDGVEPASRQVLAVLWLLGPLLALATFVLALVIKGKRWETFVNAAFCVAYGLLWALVAVL